MLFFRLFRHYFLSFKSSSLIRVVAWFCLGGLTVSVAALVLVLSIMDGFGQSIKTRLLSHQAHLIVTEKDLKQHGKFFQNQDFVYSLLPSSLKKNINSLVLSETQDILLKTSHGFSGVIAKGYKKDIIEKILLKTREKKFESLHQVEDLSTVNNIENKERSILPSEKRENKLEHRLSTTFDFYKKERRDQKNSSLPLLISEALSANLNLYEGDEVFLIPIVALLLPPSEIPPLKKGHIQGIMNSENQGEESFSVFYEKGVLDFKKFSHTNLSWEITLKEPEDYKKYLPYFKSYKVEHWAERNSSLLFALKMEKFIMILFITLSIVISCLGISVALFLLITQKRKDIGVLQAMGLSGEEVTKTFAKVGMGLSFLGITGGMLLGIALTAFLKYNQWNILPDIYYDRTLPANFLPFHYILIVFGSFGVAFLACYLPSLRLSRMAPSELLKSTGR